MKEVNVLSLCDGISGGRAALEAAGFKVNKYFASEIDKYAIAITKFNYPDTVHIGDIRGVEVSNGKLVVDGEEHKIDILLSGTPCFVAGTRVSTNKKLVPIEDIKIGDMVETHTGEYRPVVRLWEKEGTLRELKAHGFLPTITTDEHPYLVRKVYREWDNPNRTSVRKFSPPEWKKASELADKDFIGKRIPESKLEGFLTKDELTVLGRYLADGHVRKDFKSTGGRHWAVILSISETKTSSFLESLEDPTACGVYKHTEGVNRVIFYSKRLVQLIEEHCGSGAKHKYISRDLLTMPLEDSKRLLLAYLAGDGYLTKSGKYKTTTVSRDLAIGLTYLVAKVYGTCASVGVRKYKDGKGVIQGRTVNMSDSYTVEFNTHTSKADKFYVSDGIMWSRVKGNTALEEVSKVYNLEVQENNTYVANGAIVHNCTGFSFAGRQLNFEDPQSKLIFEFDRIRKDLDHKYYLLENVKMKKEFLDIITSMVGNEPVLINSSLLSAQSRQRYYWTNIPNVTQPQDKNINPLDILEFHGTVLNYSSSGRGKGKVEGRFTKAEKALTLTATGYTNRAATLIVGRTQASNDWGQRVVKKVLKFPCLTATMSKGPERGGTPLVTWDTSIDRDIRDIDKGDYRLPTPLECERLQTFPDHYTLYGDFGGVVKEVSNTQRYKCLGNGWTRDVIAHILSGINFKEEYDLL